MLQKSYICVTFVNAIENVRIMWYILITGCDICFALIKSERMKGYVKNKGITLIALVVTIIVLLILARHKYKYANRTKWNFE